MPVFFQQKLAEIIDARSLRSLVFGCANSAPAEHAFYLPWPRLNLVLSGWKEIDLPLSRGATRVRLGPGDAFFAVANSWETNSWDNPHSILCLVPRESYLRLVFYESESAQPGRRIIAPSHLHHTNRPYGEALRRTLGALEALAFAPDPAGAIELTYALLQLARQECRLTDSERTGKAFTTWNRLAGWLEDHLHESLDRNLVAAEWGLNPAYLSQLTGKMTGGGFAEYLTARRLDRAKRLLLATELTVYQIAAQCGFATSAHFVKRFRERVGVPPGKYREIESGRQNPIEP